jgi:hypothetical protein
VAAVIGRAAVALAVAAAAASCGGAPPVPLVLDLNRAPGELVDVEANAVPGMITIVDFHAAWCRACDKIEAMVLADLEHGEDIVLRRVDVGAGRTPVAEAYDVGILPHMKIYDRLRRLRYVLVGNDTLRAVEIARGLRAE